MAANTLPQMTLKMAALQQAQDKAAKSLQDGGIIGQAAKVAYTQLGDQMDKVQNQHAELASNVTILSDNFGITKGQAQQLANMLGINLTHSMSTAQVQAFRQEVQQTGLNMDTTGAKAYGMSANVISAVSAEWHLGPTCGCS